MSAQGAKKGSTMTQQNNGIIEVIRKLLALTDSPVEGEAQAAAAKVQELLFKHNLALEEIGAVGEPVAGVSAIMHITFQDPSWGKSDGSWRSLLVGRVARFNFCRALYGSQGQFWIIGTSTNTAVVRELFLWITSQLKSIGNAAYKQYTERGGFDRKPTFLRGFYYGAAISIGYRLEAQWKTLTEGSLVGTALAVRTEAKLAEYVDSTFSARKSPGGSASSASGYKAGREAGATVNIIVPRGRLGDEKTSELTG